MKPDEHANGKGIADSQIRCCRSLCRQALEKAAEEHLILCNPAIGCKCPPAKREEMKIPSGETMQRVLIQAKEENYYELFLLEFATGLRLRELAALQWDDLNLTTGELRIDKQASIVGSEVVICEPKTKAAVRTMILPPSVRRVLAEYKTKVDSRWMLQKRKIQDLPMPSSLPREHLQRLSDYTGCERVRYHGPCHTFATDE